MSQQAHIRTARPDDCELIFELITELAIYEREPLAVETTPAVLRSQLESDRCPFECLIAELDGQTAGFALYFQNYSTWKGRPGLYLEDLFVRESARKSGVGGALLGALARIAVERGYARMEWSVLDWNQLAIDFYEGLGAVPMSDWTTFRLTGEPLRRLAGR
ncbi:MAG: GNAT family N-acetyltransferase [Myxococcales bacterium]|nr:GNAT family N-acetyltransferase [Myxococcales bacterium]